MGAMGAPSSNNPPSIFRVLQPLIILHPHTTDPNYVITLAFLHMSSRLLPLILWPFSASTMYSNFPGYKQLSYMTLTGGNCGYCGIISQICKKYAAIEVTPTPSPYTNIGSRALASLRSLIIRVLPGDITSG
jgi:hypothetical protein